MLNGGSLGTWEADGTNLTVEITDFDVVVDVTLDGNPGLTSTAPGGTGGGSAPYVCQGNDTLLIDPTFELRFWPYPREWTRVTP